MTASGGTTAAEPRPGQCDFLSSGAGSEETPQGAGPSGDQLQSGQT